MDLSGVLMKDSTHWMNLYQKVYHLVMRKNTLDMMKKSCMDMKKCLWMVQ